MTQQITQPRAGQTSLFKAVDPGTRIGHVHLKVADLDRALAFYCGVLGFELTQRYGSGAAFISAGGYHHHIGLNTWESRGGSPPPAGSTGLYHVAILYPARAALASCRFPVARPRRKVVSSLRRLIRRSRRDDDDPPPCPAMIAMPPRVIAAAA